MSTQEMPKRAISVTRQELIVDDDDAEFRDLLHMFFAFSSDLNELRSQFGNYVGLSPTQYMILITIGTRRMKGAGVTELAERLYLSGAFVTIEVNRLVEAGLVRKAAHKTDRRRVQLSLTKLGIERLNSLAEFQQPVNNALFAEITPQDFRELSRLMGQLVHNGVNARKLAQYLGNK